jgi:hypothetical protein
VARDLVEHVVEERDAGGELRVAAPVEVDGDSDWVSLVSRWISALRMVSAEAEARPRAVAFSSGFRP